jgi:uncharacterized protein YfdQ (DUF2303 family)
MNSPENAETVNTLIAHGKAMAEPFDHPQGGKAVVIPDDYHVTHLAPVDEPLTHIKAAPVFDDAQSFIAYVKTYGAETARIFAEQDRTQITAILDYHQPGQAAYGAHKAICVLPHSEQWRAWVGIDGQAVPQAAFAEFIEENALDIYEPASADVLEIARSLQIKQTVEFSSSVNLANGATQLKYVEEQDGKGRGNIEVPQKIKLGLPVFFGGDLVEVWAFLRTRIKDGKLSFIVKLHRRELIIREEFNRIVARVGDETGITPLFGRP